MRRAPPGPLSGYGELIHSTITSTARAPSPSPAAIAPRSKQVASTEERAWTESNGRLRSVTWVTPAMLPTTRAFYA